MKYFPNEYDSMATRFVFAETVPVFSLLNINVNLDYDT